MHDKVWHHITANISTKQPQVAEPTVETRVGYRHQTSLCSFIDFEMFQSCSFAALTA
jgi:hypothetical protein